MLLFGMNGRGLECEGPFDFLLRGISDCDADLCGFILYIGIDLHIIEPDGVGCSQLDCADDAVPVGLGVVGDTV